MPLKLKKKRKIKKKIPIPPEIQPYYKDALILGLTEHTFQVLLENGYNNIATISAIDEPDLQALEIPLGQKSVLRRLVKGLQTETAERRTQPEVTAHVSYKREVKTQDENLNLSTEIYESGQSTLVSTTSGNQDHRGDEFEPQPTLKSSAENTFRPEIVIISTDEEDDSFGIIDKCTENSTLKTAKTGVQDDGRGIANTDDHLLPVNNDEKRGTVDIGGQDDHCGAGNKDDQLIPVNKDDRHRTVDIDDQDDHRGAVNKDDQDAHLLTVNKDGILNRDYQDDGLGTEDREYSDDHIGTVKRGEKDDYMETVKRDQHDEHVGIVNRDEEDDHIRTINDQIDHHRTLETVHAKVGHDTVDTKPPSIDKPTSSEDVTIRVIDVSSEESSLDSDVLHTSFDGSSSESGESDFDNEGGKWSNQKQTTLLARNQPNYQPLKVQGQLAKKQHSGMQLSRKSKSIQSKNTYVKGASGCIIGDNITITHNQMKEDVDIRIQTLEEQTRIAMKNYEEEEVFVPTCAYKQIKDELESSYFITVTGRPGDGKTTIAIRLLIEYSKNKRTSFICQTPEHWDAIAGLKERKVAVMVDDVFGTYVYDEMKSKPWISRFETMERIIKGSNGNIYIIFTSRFYIIEQIKPFLDKTSFFKSQYIINLSHKEFELSKFEKADILNKHLQLNNYKLDESTIKRISYTCAPHGFPHCAKLFTSSFFLYQQGLSFFKNPIECLNSEIDRFRLSDKNKFCVLALMAMEGGKLTETFLNDMNSKHEQTKTLIRVCGLPDDTPFSIMKEALICMNTVYVRQVPDGSFVFHHETVSEAVCYSLSKSNLEFALRYMDLKFISKRIKTQAWKKERDVLAICIPHNMYPMLWRRLYNEIEKKNLKQCMKHQAWEDKEFLLATSGKSQNDTKMDKSLSDLVKMICFARSFFYWAVFYRKEIIVSIALQNIDINVGELSQALVTACGKGLSLPLIQNILEKEPNLEYIETASEYENNDSEYSDIDDVLDFLFGEKLASLFQQGGITALQAAIFSRKIEIVKLLLKYGSKISTKQKMGKTALHFASAINDFDIQKYLLESLSLCPSTDKQRLINDVDKKGRTALHYAKAKYMMILLIHWEANPNARDACGHTPLLYRAKYGITYEMVEALCIVGKADINAVDNARRNVLHIALRIDRDCDIVKCILTMAKLGLNFNCRTYDGETPLMCFVKRYARPNYGWRSKAKIIQTLTECGADLNAIDSQELTALHYSIISMDQSKTVNLLLNGADPIVFCFFGCPLRYLFYHFSKLDKNMDLNRILNMMIKFMPDINYSNAQGKTLLHLILQCDITSSRMEELVNMVLQKGINTNAKDANGMTPLMMAATTSCEMLKLIIENHGILNDIDNEGRHALFHVVYEKCSKFDIVDFLLERGLSLNDRDKNGKTPLHSLLSSKHCTVECIKFYISRGANVCLKDDSGKSAIHHLCSKRGVFEHCSSECDAKKMLETLVEHRADLNNVDNEANTPLMHSCKNNTDSKVLKYLLFRNDVQKTNTNKEGQNILHLIINYLKEDDIMAVIEMLKEQNFDFNVKDNHSKSSLVYAIEKNYLSLTLELLSVTNVSDDYKTTLTICHAVIESGVLNKLSTDNSSEFASKELQNIFTKLSDRRFHSLMRIFPKAVTLPGGKNFPHLLVKSNINDDVLNYIFSLIIRQHRVSLTMTDNVGRTVLHFAIQYYKGDFLCRRISVIRLLLQQGANPNQRDVEGRTALHYCVQSSRCDNEAKEIMQCLLEHGGDPFLVNKKGKLAFELITDTVPRLRTIQCINKMFTIPSEKLQVTQLKALRSFACARDIVQSDIMHIADMVLNTWSFDFISDNKPKILHLACKYCNFKLANVLFMLPREVDIEDADGKTPLQLLITSERIQQEVQYLDECLDKWGSFYYKMEMLDLTDSFTLREAVLLLKWLLQRTADPNTRDSDGNTPLHLLLTSGWYGKYVLEAASVLLSYGADVNAVNAKGVTPLMLAASHKRIEIRAILIHIIMKHGACVLTKDVNEKDALWYSQKNISEYVRASSHNTSFTSMCATSTEANIVRSFLKMSHQSPDHVEFDELCSDDYIWL